MVYFHHGQRDEVFRLIKRYHYSHTIPGGIKFVGSFHEAGGLLGNKGRAVAGVCFSHSPTGWSEKVCELCRLVRRDDFDSVPLSRLVSLSMKHLRRVREQINEDLVVSYADSTHGHHGGIYQACSWNYARWRKSTRDFLVNGKFMSNRAVIDVFGTASFSFLKERHPDLDIKLHYGQGKYLYWKTLCKSGEKKAARLGLKKLPYPKPNRENQNASES